MAAVTTERLMEIALELAGWSAMPADCAIYYPGARISHVLMGIDVGTAELFMARQLGYHAVVALHPAGHVGPFWEVYRRHIGLMVAAGVPHDVAEAAVAERIVAMQAEAQSENYDHAASVARLLETPFLAIHSPLDEVGRRAMQSVADELLAQRPDATRADLRDALLALPAFAAAQTTMGLPLGEWNAPLGKVAVAHGAYASPDAHIARAYLSHGVTTLVCAQFPHEEARWLANEGADAAGGAILTLGHIAAHSVGANPYIARLRAEGLEVTPFSGIIGVAS
jgi:hypothetical protein